MIIAAPQIMKKEEGLWGIKKDDLLREGDEGGGTIEERGNEERVQEINLKLSYLRNHRVVIVVGVDVVDVVVGIDGNVVVGVVMTASYSDLKQGDFFR